MRAAWAAEKALAPGAEEDDHSGGDAGLVERADEVHGVLRRAGLLEPGEEPGVAGLEAHVDALQAEPA